MDNRNGWPVGQALPCLTTFWFAEDGYHSDGLDIDYACGIGPDNLRLTFGQLPAPENTIGFVYLFTITKLAGEEGLLETLWAGPYTFFLENTGEYCLKIGMWFSSDTCPLSYTAIRRGNLTNTFKIVCDPKGIQLFVNDQLELSLDHSDDAVLRLNEQPGSCGDKGDLSFGAPANMHVVYHHFAVYALVRY